MKEGEFDRKKESYLAKLRAHSSKNRYLIFLTVERISKETPLWVDATSEMNLGMHDLV